MELVDKNLIIDEYNKSNGTISDLMDIVLDSPVVDVQPVIHAKWNLADDGDGILCYNCGEDFCNIIYEEERMLYCPHCGAKMDGEG